MLSLKAQTNFGLKLVRGLGARVAPILLIPRDGSELSLSPVRDLGAIAYQEIRDSCAVRHELWTRIMREQHLEN
jgi:hypothetical protein